MTEDNKKIITLGLIFLGVLAVGLYLLKDNNDQPIGSSNNEPEFLTLTIKNTSLQVELAWIPEQQAQGLSGRRSLSTGQGMLFVYAQPETPSFWMKDMHFPIDIIWIDENNAIIGTAENLTPESYPQKFFPPSPILQVLEVNAGFVKQYNIQMGDVVNTSNLRN